MLEDGWLMDNKGCVVNFKNIIIIMIFNMGFNIICENFVNMVFGDEELVIEDIWE